MHVAEPTGTPGGHHLEIDGRSLFFRMAGDGPPTLLLHGLAATGALNWRGCFEALSGQRMVVAPDHRGHGRGMRIGNAFRLADCADDAAALLRGLGGRPAIVVGYSMGGPIAQLLARLHPDLVAGLVLSATARDFRGAPADRIRFASLAGLALASRFGPSALAPFALPLPGPLRPAGWVLSELRRHEPSAVLAASAELGRFTSRDWVRELTVPTTVLVHSEDRIVPPRRQHKLAASMPDARAVEVPIDHLARGAAWPIYVAALAQAHAAVVDRTAGASVRPAA